MPNTQITPQMKALREKILALNERNQTIMAAGEGRTAERVANVGQARQLRQELYRDMGAAGYTPKNPALRFSLAGLAGEPELNPLAVPAPAAVPAAGAGKVGAQTIPATTTGPAATADGGGDAQAGIEVIRARIANLTQLLADARASGNQAQIENLEQRLAAAKQELAFRESRQAELSSLAAYRDAQLAYLNAQYNQQIGGQQVAQEGELMQNQRALLQAYRDWIGQYGGRNMLRSGVYQQQVATGEEESALARAQIIREYNQTIQGLEAERAAGASQVALDAAAEKARINAVYQLSRLQDLAGG